MPFLKGPVLLPHCCCMEDTSRMDWVFETDALPDLAKNVPILPDLALLSHTSPDHRVASETPPDFSVRSVESADSSNDSMYVSLTEDQKSREMAKLEGMVKEFVRDMMRGFSLNVVLEDGSLISCRCFIDNKLALLTLQVRDVVQYVRMTEIIEICSGRELRNIGTTTPLDDLCVTLVMTNDQCVSFKFRDATAREHFSTCIKVLRLALD
mmetsp:Transcript_34237/g.91389  ORF Transcript_34237/g.91389 Transcript_34237/m.91389 type:complete len:210 (-) Transcript_34237:80-709(-)